MDKSNWPKHAEGGSLRMYGQRIVCEGKWVGIVERVDLKRYIYNLTE